MNLKTLEYLVEQFNNYNPAIETQEDKKLFLIKNDHNKQLYTIHLFRGDTVICRKSLERDDTSTERYVYDVIANIIITSVFVSGVINNYKIINELSNEK